MNPETIFNFAVVQNLGWTLLHSLWQIAALTIWLFVALKLSRQSSANFRYLLSCAALISALILPLATFVWLANSADGKARNSQSAVRRSALENQPLQPAEEIFDPNNANGKAETKTGGSGFWAVSFGLWSWDKFLPLVVWLWLAGVMLFAARTIGGVWRVRFLRRSQVEPVSADLERRGADLCRKIGVSPIEIRASALVAAPIIAGWLKPLILLPVSVLNGLSPAQLEAVIVHEIMHLRRFDCFVNLAQTAIEILLFYHPGAWWISAQIRREREFACDDAVVKFYGEGLNYARALANLETLRHTANQIQPSLTLAANGGKLMNRIQRIISEKNSGMPRNGQAFWAAGLVFLLISAVVVGVFSTLRPAASAAGKTTNRKMAFGFVSIPPLDRMADPPKDADATARLLIEKLKSHKVPAIGFVQGAMISDGEKWFPVRAEIVRTWRDAGLEIGIGNFKHIRFYDTPFEEYVANVGKNERVTKQLLAEKNLRLRYFSYPYLNTGKSTADKNRFESWLKERGLSSVKYTFDNDEWMYSYAYDVARKDNDVAAMKQIRAEYLDYMTKMTEHYEAYSQEMFGRDIAQTTVLTSSRLVTDTADEFFGMLEKRGYAFVPMDEAQSDEAYKTEENFVGKAGISWFERWQLAQGKKLLDEPKVSETVAKIWATKK